MWNKTLVFLYDHLLKASPICFLFFCQSIVHQTSSYRRECWPQILNVHQKTPNRETQTVNSVLTCWHQWSKKVRAHPEPLMCVFLWQHPSSTSTHNPFLFSVTFLPKPDSLLFIQSHICLIKRIPYLFFLPQGVPHPLCLCVASTWGSDIIINVEQESDSRPLSYLTNSRK